MARTTIRTEDVTDSEVTTAKMATDPTDASNLASGTVADARLGTIPTDITANQTSIVANQDDIALLGFKVAANGSLARYNLVDQSIDAFEDASGVDASASTDEVRNAANYYSGLTDGTSGGTASSHGSYTVRTFLADGTFVAPDSNDVDVLVVAGGGGGGARSFAGGGGAGGMRTGSLTVSGSISVTVGDGGAGGINSSSTASQKGDDSIFSTITSTGGGRGGDQDGGGDGGSGGGDTNYVGGAGSGNTPSTSPSQGNDGGAGCAGNYGGAGGGAGAVGGGGCSGPYTGGVGVSNDYRTGSGVFYAGGGGSGRGGTGGNGGGGDGGVNTPSGQSGSPGTANTGGGGGGANDNAGGGDGGNGGSGIVVVRWPDSQWLVGQDMTLVSNAVTAESAPTTGDLVMTYTNGAGTATINTDLKAYVSRDNGTTYTQATLADQGDTGGHTILTANGLDISSQPSGTSMRWKIETLNQSVSKETRIQAVSLGWS